MSVIGERHGGFQTVAIIDGKPGELERVAGQAFRKSQLDASAFRRRVRHSFGPERSLDRGRDVPVDMRFGQHVVQGLAMANDEKPFCGGAGCAASDGGGADLGARVTFSGTMRTSIVEKGELDSLTPGVA